MTDERLRSDGHDVASLRRALGRERAARARAERAAAAAEERLKRASELRNVFLSTVSHELRTPLTSITGFAELLVESWDAFEDEQRFDFLGRILRNSETLRQLVDELLDFTHLDREAVDLQPLETDLSAFVHQVLDDSVVLLEEHRVARAIDDGVRAAVDRGAMRRILANLLSNAARFSPKGTELTVSLVGDRLAGGDHVRLVVADQGPGIPEAERSDVFEPFYRGRHPEVLATHGSGIGLTVVRRLVELMGGRVDIADADPHGARVEVRLPPSGAGGAGA